ncbi:organic cation transporter-like protein isoform X2 [Patella vulgata]|uniref:organic cation transporter-like protein isoform X2 n=1 Tax=Patella vulgata TaxID=6465 RepID=UPI0024A9EA26|nr:organic cation transporter-like protein isoform X2 [Patella vulgata]
MKDMRHVDVDEILDALGSRGKYQILMYFLTTLNTVTEAFFSLNIIFIGQANPHKCAPPPDLPVNRSDDVFGKCSILSQNQTTVSSCIYGYQYEYPTDFSIVSDFDLVCDQAALADLSQTMLNVGMAIGASTLTLASDKYGRKPVSVLSHLACLAIGICASFAPNYTVFMVMRFLSGIVQQGSFLCAFTYAIELFPKEKRKYCGFYGSLMWGFACMLIAPIAFLTRMYSWRIVYRTLASVSLYSLIQYWVTDESIRWLVANNRLEETVTVVKKAARMNGVNINEILKLIYQNELLPVDTDKPTDKLLAATLDTGEEEEKQMEVLDAGLETQAVHIEKYTLLDIFKNRRAAITLILIWFAWFTNSLTYYGIFLISSSLAGNVYLNFFLNALVEVPSSFIYWFTIDRFGRKKMAIFFHGVAAFGLIVATILRMYDDNEAVSISATIFSLIGKLGITGSFNVVFVYTPEIFPTNVRNITIGTASTAARIGGMLAPFSNYLKRWARKYHKPWKILINLMINRGMMDGVNKLYDK